MRKSFIIITFLFSTSVLFSQKIPGYAILNTTDKCVSDLCFTKSGRVIGVTDYSSVKFFTTDSAKLITEFKNGHRTRILTVDISGDSTLMANGGTDSTIVLWDLVSGKIKNTFKYHKGAVTSLKISPDSRYILSGGSDNKVILFDLISGKISHEFTDHKDLVTSVAFCRGRNFIASSSGDGLINIYNTEEGTLIASLSGHSGWIRDIDFSNDGQRLISCGDDSRVIVWDISDITKTRMYINTKYLHGWLLSAGFNEDSRTYVVGTLNGKAIIYGQYKKYRFRTGRPVEKVAFMPGEGIYMKIAVATWGKGAFIVDASKME